MQLHSASVFCNVCKSKSHPTSDCPVKHKRRQQQNPMGQAAIMAAEDDDGFNDENDQMQSITAGMETLEDNPDEEYYRFIQGVAKTKQEKEKMKALAYIAASERAALGEDQALPMQDHVEMDGYPNGAQGEGMAIGMANNLLLIS